MPQQFKKGDKVRIKGSLNLTEFIDINRKGKVINFRFGMALVQFSKKDEHAFYPEELELTK